MEIATGAVAPLFKRPMKLFTSIIILLFAALTLSGAAKIPADWAELVNCRRDEGNLLFESPWDGVRSVQFIVQSRQTGEAVRLEISSAGVQMLLLPETGFREVAYPVRKTAELPPTAIRPAMPILFKFREDRWSLYLDNRIRAVFPAPFALPAAILFPVNSQLTPSAARFQPVPRVDYSTDFMIEEGAANQLYPWVRQAGSWRIHTALDEALVRPETNLAQTKRAPLTADKSPNFYSLKGGGSNAIITTGYDYFDNYQLTGSLQLDEGEAGLVFYYRSKEADPDSEVQQTAPVDEEFYALTLQIHGNTPDQQEMRLWHSRHGQRRYLARAQIPLYRRQWVQPGIKIADDLIIASLDGFEVFRVREPLPPGGKIGFFANAEEELRFDDVRLQNFNSTTLEYLHEIRFYQWHHSGGFFQNPAFLRPGTPDEQKKLKAVAEKQEETLILGRPWNRNLVFSTTVCPKEANWKLGLLAGYRTAQDPHYLLRLERSAEQYRGRLLERTDNETKELDTFSFPAPPETFQLMLDASEKGRVRFLLDGKLLAIVNREDDLHGAAGLWLGKNSQAEFSQLTITRQREIYREQEQKNPVFQADNFMRHWASPEGQWIAGENGIYWHKGDFFGDFAIRLPAVSGSELQVAVPENSLQGAMLLKVTETGIQLTLQEPEDPEPRSAEFLLPEADKGKAGSLIYELHCEGHLLWLSWNEKAVLQMRLRQPMKRLGTRVLAKGLKIPDLAKSKVTRSMVIDEFFNESPYAWLAAGGDWQIINRFQCTPSWSHMIGEAPDGLGAFWRKQVFSGDLTLEFYAGTRHGFYDDAGNLNCTIMASETSPSTGYTFNTTEWDHNRSQNWSRFYRNGNLLGSSEAYLVPRLRKGMTRRILNPLVSEGRPIHGAWYYLKIRKIGKLIEFYFDDEKIYSTTDEDPLQEGLVGIWTFVHSMTLAQIKITCEQARSRSFPVRMLALNAPERTVPTVEPPLQAVLGGFPVDSLHPAYWQLEDPVGQSTRSSFARNATAILVQNQLGGGNMLLKSLLPATSLKQTAGWFVRVKRSRKAQFNLSFQLGPLGEGRQMTPKESYFHHISGPRFSEDKWQMTGSSPVFGSAGIQPDHQDWQDVFAWIPSRLRTGENLAENRGASLHAFGIEQLDFLSSGISGNGPGQAYALQSLQPIFYDLPDLKIPPDTTVYARYPWNTLFWGKTSDPEELRQRLIRDAREGLNQVSLLFRKGRQSLCQDLFWIKLPAEVPFTLEWDAEVPDALRLTSSSTWVDPRFAVATAKIGALELSPESNLTESRLFRLPPANPEIQAAFTAGSLTVTVNPGSGEKTVTIALPPHRRNAPPVLCRLKGFTTFFKNYECPDSLKDKEDKLFLSFENSPQRQFLLASNRAGRARLQSTHTSSLSLAAYPVFQFRYRAEDMSHISLVFNNSHYVRISPEDVIGRSVQPRLAPEFQRDEQWHTWTGLVSDAFNRDYFSVQRFLPGGFQLRSISGSDQTGRFSKISLDDLVLGPAIKGSEQLSCIPEYEDHDGIENVFFCLLQGSLPYWEILENTRSKLNWQKQAPGQEMKPDLADFPDGVHHLLLKAVDKQGLESAVTDLPFLLDRAPLQISHQIRPSKDLLLNGSELLVTLNNDGGAPWAIEKAIFQAAGKERKIVSWSNRYLHSVRQENLILNYPLILRDELNQSKDGDTIEFALENLQDGAGNSTPRHAIPVKIDYATDKTGPTWEQLAFQDSILAFFNWDGRHKDTLAFTSVPPERSGDLEVLHTADASPCLASYTHNRHATISTSVKWKPEQYPYLSFRLQCAAIREKMMIHVLLTTDQDKVYTISLTAPRKNVLELNRTQTFEWTAGKWQNFSFDVRQMLLDAGLKPEELQAITFKSVGFRRLRAENRDQMLLDDFFIHRQPEKVDTPDVLKWLAFDCSGVASLDITAIDNQDKDLWQHSFPLAETADLNVLRKKFSGRHWLRCCARDKAGNLSIPFWMPMQGSAQ